MLPPEYDDIDIYVPNASYGHRDSADDYSARRDREREQFAADEAFEEWRQGRNYDHAYDDAVSRFNNGHL